MSPEAEQNESRGGVKRVEAGLNVCISEDMGTDKNRYGAKWVKTSDGSK